MALGGSPLIPSPGEAPPPRPLPEFRVLDVRAPGIVTGTDPQRHRFRKHATSHSHPFGATCYEPGRYPLPERLTGATCYEPGCYTLPECLAGATCYKPGGYVLPECLAGATCYEPDGYTGPESCTALHPRRS